MADPDNTEPTPDQMERVEVVTATRAGMDDAADPKQAKKKALRAQDALSVSIAFWSDIMGTEQGRREMWTLLNQGEGHPFGVRFGVANGMPQPEASWLEAGKQGHGFDQYLYLLSLLPELTTMMLMENEPRVLAVQEKVAELAKPRRTRKQGASQSPR